ncbi:MAG: right-handed parallel beta-helix repeat-containing protein [Nitrospirales bacterium]
MKKLIIFKKIPFMLGGLILILSTFVAGAAHATFYYVAINGNDSSNGSEASPFRTIKHGVTVLAPGDTLYVKAGTYKEYITNDKSFRTNIFIPNGKSWDEPVTVAANPGDTVTIMPGSGKAFFWIMDGQDKYLIIDGFIVDGQNTASHGFKFTNGTRYIRVENSEIKNSVYTGVIVTNTLVNRSTYGLPADTYHEFKNLHVHHNGTNVKDHGFYIETSHNLVENCDIHHNSGNGGKFYMSDEAGGGGTSNNNIFRYSTTHDNSTNCQTLCTGWLLGSGKGNQAYGNISYNQPVGFSIGSHAIDNILYNNIAYDNIYYGIHVYGDWGGSDHAMVYNNTVYNNHLYGIGVRTGSRDTVIKNNIAYNNGANSSANIYLQPDQSPGTVAEKNLLTDPKFVDHLKHDFKLQSGSPAIDSGVNLPEVKVDFFGVERYRGKAYDIGAIEQDLADDSTPPATPTGFKVLF